MYLFKIHIQRAHNQRPLSETEKHPTDVFLWRSPIPTWCKEISYGNLAGDGIVSYVPQRVQEQCPILALNTWIKSNFNARPLIVHPDFKWRRRTSICRVQGLKWITGAEIKLSTIGFGPDKANKIAFSIFRNKFIHRRWWTLKVSEDVRW